MGAADRCSMPRLFGHDAASRVALFAGLQPARQRGGDDDRIGSGAVLAIELDLLDARSPLFNLFRRNENLPHVFVGLAEMLLQFQHPLVQALEVVMR